MRQRYFCCIEPCDNWGNSKNFVIGQNAFLFDVHSKLSGKRPSVVFEQILISNWGDAPKDEFRVEFQ